MGLTGDRLQRFVARAQLVLLDNCGVASEVIGGLRIVHVGNCNEPHFLPLASLLQRAQCRFFFLDISVEQISGAQHVEIRHRHAHDQVLLLRREVHRGGLVGGTRALETIPLGKIDNALPKVEPPAVVIYAGSKTVRLLHLQLPGELVYSPNLIGWTKRRARRIARGSETRQ